MSRVGGLPLRATIPAGLAAEKEAKMRLFSFLILGVGLAALGRSSSQNDCRDGTCLVPACTFVMGLDDAARQLVAVRQYASKYSREWWLQEFQNERPSHRVTVPTFRIDRFEVTVAQYRACVDAGACFAPVGAGDGCNWGVVGRERHPVNCASWDQARAYCRWAGKRLCSESEWEKAARGTDGRLYPWGDERPTCKYAVMAEKDDGCGTHSTMAVGAKPAGASPYGVMDLAGNVAEWVEDGYHGDYEGAPADGSTWGGDIVWRVVRGGNFTSIGPGVRASKRGAGPHDMGGPLAGIRCCGTP